MTEAEIKSKAVDNADKKIKEVDKNSLSAIADYDRGLIEGYIDGYNEAINNIIKHIISGYLETKRELLKDTIDSFNANVESGHIIKVNDNLFRGVTIKELD